MKKSKENHKNTHFHNKFIFNKKLGILVEDAKSLGISCSTSRYQANFEIPTLFQNIDFHFSAEFHLKLIEYRLFLGRHLSKIEYQPIFIPKRIFESCEFLLSGSCYEISDFNIMIELCEYPRHATLYKFNLKFRTKIR